MCYFTFIYIAFYLWPITKLLGIRWSFCCSPSSTLQYFQCVTLQTWFGCMLQRKTLQKCLLLFTSSKGRLKMSPTYGALLPDSVWTCCRRSMCSQVGCPSFWHCLGGKIQVEMVCVCDYIFCSIPGTTFSPGHGKQFVMIWEGICWDLKNKLQSE